MKSSPKRDNFNNQGFDMLNHNARYQQEYDDHQIMQTSSPNTHLGKPLVSLTLKQSNTPSSMNQQTRTPQRSIENFNASQMVNMQQYDSSMNKSFTKD
jgi:hypothetical protein